MLCLDIGSFEFDFQRGYVLANVRRSLLRLTRSWTRRLLRKMGDAVGFSRRGARSGCNHPLSP